MKTRLLVMPGVRWAFNSSRWQPSKQDWTRVGQLVQTEEKERIGKFVFKRDAKSSMAGRLMLRKVIHHMTKIQYNEIKLARTDKGKPYLLNPLPPSCPDLSFNLSHQGDYVVLAAETSTKVGVDVMNSEASRLKSVSEFFHTMRRQFTDAEWRCIRSSPEEKEQLKTFYRLWCLKESYVKALGVGIGFEVRRLDFDLATPLSDDPASVTCSTTLRVDGSKVSDWRFEETLLDGHCIAVALQSASSGLPPQEDTPVEGFTVLTLTELLEGSIPQSDADPSYGEQFSQKSENPESLKAKQNSSR